MKQVLKFEDNLFDFGDTKAEQAKRIYAFKQELNRQGIRVSINECEPNKYNFFGNSLDDIERAVQLYYGTTKDKFVEQKQKSNLLVLTATKVEYLSKMVVGDGLANIWLAIVACLLLFFAIIFNFMFISLPKSDIIKYIVFPLITGVPAISVLWFIWYACWKLSKKQRILS